MSDSTQEKLLNTRRFQFRTVDVLLVTVVVALTIMAAKEGPIYGKAHSPIMLVVLAGILGAVTGRLVSGAFRSGLVGGLLLGVLGYLLAVFAVSLGIKITDKTLFFVCVCSGGVIGGLIPTTPHWWRQASFRSRISILLVGFGLLITLTFRWWTVSTQTHFVAELRAAGASIYYSDVNPFPTTFDSNRMQPRSEWLRKLLGLRR